MHPLFIFPLLGRTLCSFLVDNIKYKPFVSSDLKDFAKQMLIGVSYGRYAQDKWPTCSLTVSGIVCAFATRGEILVFLGILLIKYPLPPIWWVCMPPPFVT